MYTLVTIQDTPHHMMVIVDNSLQQHLFQLLFWRSAPLLPLCYCVRRVSKCRQTNCVYPSDCGAATFASYPRPVTRLDADLNWLFMRKIPTINHNVVIHDKTLQTCLFKPIFPIVGIISPLFFFFCFVVRFLLSAIITLTGHCFILTAVLACTLHAHGFYEINPEE